MISDVRKGDSGGSLEDANIVRQQPLDVNWHLVVLLRANSFDTISKHNREVRKKLALGALLCRVPSAFPKRWKACAKCFAFLFARLSLISPTHDTLTLYFSAAIIDEITRSAVALLETSVCGENGNRAMTRQLLATGSPSPNTTWEPLSDEAARASDNGSHSPAKVTRKRRVARPLQLPRDRLALAFQHCREQSGLSFSQLAERSGVDVAHIWRIEQGEHQNVSREILILLSIAMVHGSQSVDLVVDVANEILDAAGLKMLRAPQDAASLRITDPHSRKSRRSS